MLWDTKKTPKNDDVFPRLLEIAKQNAETQWKSQPNPIAPLLQHMRTTHGVPSKGVQAGQQRSFKLKQVK